MYRATEVVFDHVQPAHGVIAVRLVGVNDAEALLSAIEVTPKSSVAQLAVPRTP